MHPSPFDFVSVLSREECCSLCTELHAAVDQCECSECSAFVCPDCASLRPDTTWICAACAPTAAALAFPQPAGPFAQSLRLLRASVSSTSGSQRGEAWASPIGPLWGAVALIFARTRVGALSSLAVALLFARTTRSHTLRTLQRLALRARPALAHASSIARRLLAMVSSHGRRGAARAGAIVARGVRSSATQLRAQAGRAWLRVASTVIALRSFPLRHHAVSLVIATSILIAVARSQTNSDAR